MSLLRASFVVLLFQTHALLGFDLSIADANSGCNSLIKQAPASIEMARSQSLELLDCLTRQTRSSEAALLSEILRGLNFVPSSTLDCTSGAIGYVKSNDARNIYVCTSYNKRSYGQDVFYFIFHETTHIAQNTGRIPRWFIPNNFIDPSRGRFSLNGECQADYVSGETLKQMGFFPQSFGYSYYRQFPKACKDLEEANIRGIMPPANKTTGDLDRFCRSRYPDFYQACMDDQGRKGGFRPGDATATPAAPPPSPQPRQQPPLQPRQDTKPNKDPELAEFCRRNFRIEFFEECMTDQGRRGGFVRRGRNPMQEPR